jgi:DNA-binding LytR/AlgR family response regulator
MLKLVMLLPNGRKWDNVPVSSIQYVVCDKRLRKLVTVDREYRLSSSLEAIEAQLPKQLFVRTHKSCIVSVSYISSIGKSELTVAGMSLPVARRVRSGLYKRFAKLF